MKCEACKRELHLSATVYDVAISQHTADEVDKEENDFDPQMEGYICEPCYFTIPLSIRRALT